jgi:hypothetical protein
MMLSAIYRRALGARARKGNMDIFDIQNVEQGIREQAMHVQSNNAPVTARICLAQLALLKQNTRTGQQIAKWQGSVLADALPLRVAGGLHHLHLTGADKRLGPVYDGSVTDQTAIDDIVGKIVALHDAAILSWLDSPPQTNEAGRSASFMAGLQWLSGKLGPRFELNELGASAGINTMMDRYHYNLGGVIAGPPESPMQIKPKWRGALPPDTPVEITAITGCDQAPIDLSDPASALRVKSYVWPENHDRITRMNAAITLASQKAPLVEAADAADWVDRRITSPQTEGVARVFHHSIVWQYIPADRRQRIHDAIYTAGVKATQDKPLVWMMLETNRATFRHELIIRYWNGEADSGKEHLLAQAQAQAHGAWIEWFA